MRKRTVVQGRSLALAHTRSQLVYVKASRLCSIVDKNIRTDRDYEITAVEGLGDHACRMAVGEWRATWVGLTW